MTAESRSTVKVERANSGTYATVTNPGGRIVAIWPMHMEPPPDDWPDEWKQATDEGRASLGLGPAFGRKVTNAER